MPAGPRCPNHLRRAGSRGSSPRPFTSSGSHTLPSVRPGPGPFSRPRSRCGAAARRVAPARRGGRLSASGAPSAAGPLFPAPLLRRCRQACSEMTWTRTARGPLFTAPIQSISLVPTCPPEPPAASPPPRGIRDASRGFGSPPPAPPLSATSRHACTALYPGPGTRERIASRCPSDPSSGRETLHAAPVAAAPSFEGSTTRRTH